MIRNNAYKMLIFVSVVLFAGAGACKLLSGSGTVDGAGDSGQTAPVDIDYAITLPTHSDTTYGSNDSDKFTVNFTNPDGATVTCSYNGGSTYTACDSATTIVFTADQYTNGTVLKIKFVLSGSEEIYSFTPQTQFPGLTLFDCDYTIDSATASGLTFADFETNYFGVSDRTICIDGDLTIADTSSAYIELNLPNVTVIGSSTGAKPIIRNSGTSGIFRLSSGATNAKFVNLQLEAAGSGFHVYAVGGGTIPSPKVIELSDITVNGTGSNAYGLYVTSGVQSVTLNTSTITHSVNSSSIRIQSCTSCSITVNNSTLDSPNLSPTIYASSGIININNSTIVGGLGGGSAITAYSGGTVNLSQVVLESRYYAISLNNCSSPCIVNMDRVMMKRKNESGGSNQPAIDVLGGGAGQVNSVGLFQNVACNELTTSGYVFTQVQEAHAGNFDPTDVSEQNLNNTTISDCSTYTEVAP